MRMQGIVTRQLSLWLAIVAVLMGALAPSVSQALGLGGSGVDTAWAEVCSSKPGSGTDGRTDAPLTPDTAHLFEHCPYCSLHTPTLGMPPAVSTLALQVDLGTVLPPLYLSGPSKQHNWTVAHPRGPPVASLN